MCVDFFFFFKQKTAYELRISDWSSDVCSSDLGQRHFFMILAGVVADRHFQRMIRPVARPPQQFPRRREPLFLRPVFKESHGRFRIRSEERRGGKEWGGTGRSRGAPYN